jgi:hypothetical protein
MFKAIKEFFFGKPVTAPKVEECPVMAAPVATPVEDYADIAIAQRPVAAKPAAKPAQKPAAIKAPAKKQGGQKPAKTGGAKPAKTGAQKPKGGRKPKAANKPAAK